MTEVINLPYCCVKSFSYVKVLSEKLRQFGLPMMDMSTLRIECEGHAYDCLERAVTDKTGLSHVAAIDLETGDVVNLKFRV